MPHLFDPVTVGTLRCPNRVFMAPLTRCRATPGSDAPNALMADYYAQRATAGLIVSEATQILPEGKGYMGTPGIYSEVQAAGWRLVTDAVHAAGGRIFAQLWHVGAISHPDLQPGGALPVSASDGFDPGGTVYTPQGKQTRVPARGLRRDELPGVIAAYAHAARTALEAGFDGVEIHSANGYLLEQFIRDSSNRRTDDYGGSIGNRLRLVLEVVDAAISVWGSGRVGIRLSPVSAANAARQDSHPQATYGTLVEALAARRLAYVHFVEGNTGGERRLDGFDFLAARHTLAGAGVAYVANNRYDRALALAAVAENRADAIAFGVPFIANPDLPERLAADAPLNTADPKTFYSPGPAGYTDYPTMRAK